MNESQKYCRSLHVHISLGTISDDRFMPSGYIKAFSDMPSLVLKLVDYTKYGWYSYEFMKTK